MMQGAKPMLRQGAGGGAAMDNRPNAFASSFPFVWPWSGATTLQQPILPGWSFGNVIVNNQNSSAPAMELDIVSAESYGRQIGKLLDAVAVLIEERGQKNRPGALAQVVALRERVEQIKTESAARRLDQVAADLTRLQEDDPAAYEARVTALRRLIER